MQYKHAMGRMMGDDVEGGLNGQHNPHSRVPEWIATYLVPHATTIMFPVIPLVSGDGRECVWMNPHG